jgi:molybdopterin converting factor small subunit
MVEIELRVYASLRRYRPEAPLDRGERILVPEGTTVNELIQSLEIPLDEVHTVFVNRRARAPETPLQGGDRVDLFPAVAGG